MLICVPYRVHSRILTCVYNLYVVVLFAGYILLQQTHFNNISEYLV
jgi:hypothetical protein